MSFSQEAGYVPTDIETIMLSIMNNINTQFGTSYTTETFLGTNFYKYFYALAQELQENEVKTSEIFLKLQQYIDQINARISRPVVTAPGVIEKLAEPTELNESGYLASAKPMVVGDAGKIHLCVDVDDGDHATGNVTITNFANLVSGTDDTITVGATAFTAQAGAATPGDATFQAATSNSTTAISLAAQINAHATAGALVYARAIGAVVRITAVNGGTAGNAIALAYTDNDTNVGATVSGALLTGGTTNGDYADLKAEICEIIKDSTVIGAITQGTESETIVLSNGQSFDYKFNLPQRLPIYLRLTLTTSENNQVVIGNPDDTKLLLVANIAERYALGKNFEPQKYFGTVDAPWASEILLEYSEDEITWSSDVYDSLYNELFEIDLTRVTLVEA